MKVVAFSCSEYEAKNYGEPGRSFSYSETQIFPGRFLLGVLMDLSKWFTDEQLFLQDNRTKSGGKPVYLPGFQRRWGSKTVIALEDLLTWQEFRSVVRKWHRKLANVWISRSLIFLFDT